MAGLDIIFTEIGRNGLRQINSQSIVLYRRDLVWFQRLSVLPNEAMSSIIMDSCMCLFKFECTIWGRIMCRLSLGCTMYPFGDNITCHKLKPWFSLFSLVTGRIYSPISHGNSSVFKQRIA